MIPSKITMKGKYRELQFSYVISLKMPNTQETWEQTRRFENQDKYGTEERTVIGLMEHNGPQYFAIKRRESNTIIDIYARGRTKTETKSFAHALGQVTTPALRLGKTIESFLEKDIDTSGTIC